MTNREKKLESKRQNSLFGESEEPELTMDIKEVNECLTAHVTLPSRTFLLSVAGSSLFLPRRAPSSASRFRAGEGFGRGQKIFPLTPRAHAVQPAQGGVARQGRRQVRRGQGQVLGRRLAVHPPHRPTA